MLGFTGVGVHNQRRLAHSFPFIDAAPSRFVSHYSAYEFARPRENRFSSINTDEAPDSRDFKVSRISPLTLSIRTDRLPMEKHRRPAAPLDLTCNPRTKKNRCISLPLNLSLSRLLGPSFHFETGTNYPRHVPDREAYGVITYVSGPDTRYTVICLLQCFENTYSFGITERQKRRSR